MDEFLKQVDPVDRKKVEKLLKIGEDKDFAMYEEVTEIKEHLEGIHESLKTMSEHKMEMPETHKVEIEGIEVITLKGDKGDTGEKGLDGKDYVLTDTDKKEIASKIKVPVVEKVIEKTEVIREQPIVTNEIKEVAKYETAEQIKQKLLDVGLKIEDVQNLRKELDEMKKGIERRPLFGGGGFNYSTLSLHIVDDETPTGTINGVNTVFTIANTPSPVSSLKVYLNGQRLRITEDYTFSGVTITFTTAPQTGSVLLVDYRL